MSKLIAEIIKRESCTRKVPVNITINEVLDKEARALSRLTGESLSSVYRAAIRHGLDYIIEQGEIDRHVRKKEA